MASLCIFSVHPLDDEAGDVLGLGGPLTFGDARIHPCPAGSMLRPCLLFLDVRFTHAWAGAIDTCSRFSVFFGTGLGGKVAYAAGYTGLGVGATRWGARTALDLVDGRDTERTRLRMVRTKPRPFPPEPFRYAGIWLTRRALARADRREGKRGPWLKLLDAAGLGFDS